MTPPSTAAVTPRKRRWLFWSAVLSSAAMVALLAITLIVGVWLLRSVGGQQQLLSWLPGLSADAVQVIEPSGDLRGSFSARQVRIQTTNADIVIDGLRYQLLDYDVRPARLHFATLHADAMTVTTRPSAEPTVMPENLKLPLVLLADALELGRLEVRPAARAPDQPGFVVQSIRGRLALGNDKHSINLTTATLDTLQVSADAEVGVHAPMPLTARAQARQIAGNDAALSWSATASAAGPLNVIKLNATVAALDQSVAAQAVVRPFAAIPVTTLDAAFDRFDLRKLRASLPQTLLTGRAVIALDKVPLQIDVSAVNAAPGAIDSGRLPLAELRVRANGVAGKPGEWTISAFNARLQGQRPAGTVTGSGEWRDGPWSLNFNAREVRVQEIQSTLPALELTGDVRAVGSGINIAQQPVALTSTLRGVALGDVRAIPMALRGGFNGTIDAQLLSEKLELKQLNVSAGDTRLTATGTAQLAGKAGDKTWQVNSDAQWTRFDPFAWSTAPSTQSAQLSGSLKATATLPQKSLQKPQALTAQGQLQDSRWAGQALTGKFDLRLLGMPSGVDTPLRIESSGDVRLGSNAASWSGRVGALTDVLNWRLDAPALEQLWAAGKVGTASLQGRLKADGEFAGGWNSPAIRANFEGVDVVTSGTAASLIKGTLQAALRADAPLLLDLSAQRVRPYRAPAATGSTAATNEPPPEIDVTLQGRGTLAAHRVTAQATVRQKARKFALDSALTGALSFDRAGAPASWQATVQSLTADEEVAKTIAVSGKQNWLTAASLVLRWQRGGAGQPQSFTLDPGSVAVAGVTLAWDRAYYAALASSGGPSQLDFSGRIEPFALADVARRMGNENFSGDLQMRGQFKALGVPGTPAFTTQIDLARVSGDLRAGDADGALPLGLRELSLRLKADSQLWQLSVLGEGQRFGRAEANASVRTASTGGIPEAASALTGNIQARIDDLSVWNTLLPTGWRIGGGVNGSASLGGTLGVPTANGALTLVNASVRNAIEGVDITRGQGRLAFDGTTLRLDNVTAQAGKGSVRVTGGGAIDGKTPLVINATFDQFAALGRVDRRVDISGTANLSLAEKQVMVNGKLTVDRGLIDITQLGAPALSDDVVVIRKSDAQRPVAAGTTPKVMMNLAVDLGKDLRLIGRGIETRLVGDLTLTTPSGVLSAVGNIRAEGGRYEAYGQMLDVEKSAVRFVGPINNPILEILALRPNRENDDRVGVSITGTALQPRIKLYAVPERSDTDKLAMLVLGRNFDELGRDETALIQTAALALIAGEGGGSFSSKLGLDTLSVRQASGSSATKDVVITVGKQISDKVYVGYEQGLAGTAGTAQLIYRISQRITLRAQAGQEDSSLDAILTFRWR